MAIDVRCACGSSYDLKDELAGRLLQCPKCGAKVQVPAAAKGGGPRAGGVFDRDRFLLRQKHLAISAKYHVCDEQGQAILFVERPAHLARNLVAIFGGIFAGLFSGVLCGIAVNMAVPGETAGIIVGSVVGLFDLIFVMIALSPKRHVTFYRDDSMREPLLRVLQDRKFQPIVATYTVATPDGQLLARLSKNYIYNFIRKRWYCRAPDGAVLCVAKEDSLILSLLRRFLGPFFGILRTNFVILEGGNDRVIGEFNRKFTILDRYTLDMSADPGRVLDRRIALALGVMLDTGERR